MRTLFGRAVGCLTVHSGLAKTLLGASGCTQKSTSMEGLGLVACMCVLVLDVVTITARAGVCVCYPMRSCGLLAAARPCEIVLVFRVRLCDRIVCLQSRHGHLACWRAVGRPPFCSAGVFRESGPHRCRPQVSPALWRDDSCTRGAVVVSCL